MTDFLPPDDRETLQDIVLTWADRRDGSSMEAANRRSGDVGGQRVASSRFVWLSLALHAATLLYLLLR